VRSCNPTAPITTSWDVPRMASKNPSPSRVSSRPNPSTLERLMSNATKNPAPLFFEYDPQFAPERDASERHIHMLDVAEPVIQFLNPDVSTRLG
jgi:hypothetical protein